ncbi:Transcriptional regulator, MarR family [Desulfamplus magnetovallimortis]|uniref:Transcriptional regulator, MarR family n=1 Tax=Desulfamplus magnetovallimortis TaxID=1246637 RepID=A0A1W1HJM0_9BACT|nr:MarR family transcriptional regulator [Desulfamplus magnetovallimortis]SLM32605.1 Transcriptional regulator, MarR family [Desulfamplus magnetovallimortis]
MNTERTEQRCRELLVSLRKIIQAIDIHSRDLNKSFGLTGPQLVVLQEISNHGQISITPLSKCTSLSQATVTDITKRLEAKGYISRKQRKDDKRAVSLFLTEAGEEILNEMPPPLQATFTKRFSKIENWEQMMILSAFERVVALMAADELDASPILLTGPIQKTLK